MLPVAGVSFVAAQGYILLSCLSSELASPVWQHRYVASAPSTSPVRVFACWIAVVAWS